MNTPIYLIDFRINFSIGFYDWRRQNAELRYCRLAFPVFMKWSEAMWSDRTPPSQRVAWFVFILTFSVWGKPTALGYAYVSVWVSTDNGSLIFYWVFVFTSLTHRKTLKPNGVCSICIIRKFIMTPCKCWKRKCISVRELLNSVYSWMCIALC